MSAAAVQPIDQSHLIALIETRINKDVDKIVCDIKKEVKGYIQTRKSPVQVRENYKNFQGDTLPPGGVTEYLIFDRLQKAIMPILMHNKNEENIEDVRLFLEKVCVSDKNKTTLAKIMVVAHAIYATLDIVKEMYATKPSIPPKVNSAVTITVPHPSLATPNFNASAVDKKA